MRPIVNMSEEDRATDIGNMHKNLAKIARVVPEISCRTDTHTHRQAGWFFATPLRPQFRTLPVPNTPELRSLHAAAPPVQSEYPVERRAAAAVPLPESP